MVDVLDDVRLYDISFSFNQKAAATRMTYMPKCLHDIKFSIDLVVQYPVLQKSSLLAFFNSEHFAALLSSKFEDRRECSRSDASNNIVLVSASPVTSIVIGVRASCEANYLLFRRQQLSSLCLTIF